MILVLLVSEQVSWTLKLSSLNRPEISLISYLPMLFMTKSPSSLIFCCLTHLPDCQIICNQRRKYKIHQANSYSLPARPFPTWGIFFLRNFKKSNQDHTQRPPIKTQAFAHHSPRYIKEFWWSFSIFADENAYHFIPKFQRK